MTPDDRVQAWLSGATRPPRAMRQAVAQYRARQNEREAIEGQMRQLLAQAHKVEGAMAVLGEVLIHAATPRPKWWQRLRIWPKKARMPQQE